MSTTRETTNPADGQAAKQPEPASGKVDPATSQGRVLPAGGPVDVPRVPKPQNAKDDVAGKDSKPPANERGDTSWADSELPAPNKKTARSNPY